MTNHAVLVDGGQQVIVRHRAGLVRLALLLVVRGGDTGNLAKPVNPVLADLDTELELVDDEPIAQRRIVDMDVVDDAQKVPVAPATLTDGVLKLLVVALG